MERFGAGKFPAQGQPFRVSIAAGSPSDQDRAATEALIQAYSKADGFHCPRCGEVITDPNRAVEHVVDEINKALRSLGA